MGEHVFSMQGDQGSILAQKGVGVELNQLSSTCPEFLQRVICPSLIFQDGWNLP